MTLGLVVLFPALIVAMVVAAWVLYSQRKQARFVKQLQRAIDARPAPYVPSLTQEEIDFYTASRWD